MYTHHHLPQTCSQIFSTSFAVRYTHVVTKQMKEKKHIHSKRIQLVIQRGSKQVFICHKAPRIHIEDEGDVQGRMKIMMIGTPHHVNKHSKKIRIYSHSSHTMFHSHIMALYTTQKIPRKS